VGPRFIQTLLILYVLEIFMFLRIASPYMAHVGLAILSDPQRYTLPYINRDTLLRLGTVKKYFLSNIIILFVIKGTIFISYSQNDHSITNEKQ